MIKFDDQFNIVDRWFGRTVIHVNKDYSYEQAQDVIETLEKPLLVSAVYETKGKYFAACVMKYTPNSY